MYNQINVAHFLLAKILLMSCSSRVLHGSSGSGGVSVFRPCAERLRDASLRLLSSSASLSSGETLHSVGQA